MGRPEGPLSATDIRNAHAGGAGVGRPTKGTAAPTPYIVGRMEAVLIGIILAVIIVGGVLALGAIVQMVKSPYRDR